MLEFFSSFTGLLIWIFNTDFAFYLVCFFVVSFLLSFIFGWFKRL